MSAAGWKFAAASVIGTSHLKQSDGICQDAHACHYDHANQRMVCIVSDGAGSASRSADGSRLVCELMLKAISSAPEDMVHTQAFALRTLEQARDSLGALAHLDDVRIREFACTLLVAIIDSEHSTFWQIGDGAICFRMPAEEAYRFAFWPEKGEYANTTYFVTDEKAADNFEFDTMPEAVADIALFSDGLERLALDFKAGEAHTKFFSGLFPYLYVEAEGRAAEIENNLEAFLASERINSKTDDDKTLVLATRESQ